GTGTEIGLQLLKYGTSDFAVSADWTPAAGDVKISIDKATEVNIGTLPVYTNGWWVFVLTAAETTGKSIRVKIVDSAVKAINDDYFIVETFANASSQFPPDFSDSIRQGMTALPPATAGTTGGLLLFGTGTGSINPTGGCVPNGSIANQLFTNLFANGTPRTWS